MSVEIAHAHVAVTAQMPGIVKNVKQSLGAGFEAAAATIPKQYGNPIGTKVAGFVSGAFKKIIAGAGIGAAIATAATIKGGWTRALDIQDAKASLTGLGHDAVSVQNIMDNAMAAVKGTAFGMGDAASVAASAVAAGVKPGQDLERTLRLVGDAATIAKTDMGSMGSIFNKVAASNKMQMDVVNQLQDRGVPILQLVAKQMGITTEEAAKMASEGKINFEIFQKAMEEGLGGAALKSGDTLRGSIKNLFAAFSRIGEKVITPLLPLISKMVGGFTKFADSVGAKVEPAVANLIPKVQAFASYLQANVLPALVTIGQTLVDWAPTLLKIAKPVAMVVAGFAAFKYVQHVITAVRVAMIGLNLAMAANPIGIIVVAIGALVAGLIYAYQNCETFRDAVNNAWESIWSTIGPIVEWIGDAISLLWEGFNSDGPAESLSGFAAAGRTVRDVLETIWSAAKVVIDWVVETLWPKLVDAFKAIGNAFSTAWEWIKAIWDKIGGPVLAFISIAATNLYNTWSAIWSAIQDVIAGAWGIITGIIEIALSVITGIWNTFAAVFSGDWEGAWEAIKTMFSGVWEGLQNVLSGALEAIKGLIKGIFAPITGAWNTVWDKVGSTLTGAWTSIKNGVSNGITSVLDYFRKLPGRIVSALGNIGSTLWNAGKKLLQGFIDGITSMWQSVKDTLSGLTDFLPDWKGPPDKDKTILKRSGHLVMQGFVTGLKDEFGAVKQTLNSLTGSLGADLVPDLGLTQNVVPAASPITNINVSMAAVDPQAAALTLARHLQLGTA